MLLGVVLVGRALEERAKLQASADMAALQVCWVLGLEHWAAACALHMAWPGLAWHSMAWHGSGMGMEQHGTAQHGMA